MLSRKRAFGSRALTVTHAGPTSHSPWCWRSILVRRTVRGTHPSSRSPDSRPSSGPPGASAGTACRSPFGGSGTPGRSHSGRTRVRGREQPCRPRPRRCSRERSRRPRRRRGPARAPMMSAGRRGRAKRLRRLHRRRGHPFASFVSPPARSPARGDSRSRRSVGSRDEVCSSAWMLRLPYWRDDHVTFATVNESISDNLLLFRCSMAPLGRRIDGTQATPDR